jgi:hypothetical protein
VWGERDKDGMGWEGSVYVLVWVYGIVFYTVVCPSVLWLQVCVCMCDVSVIFSHVSIVSFVLSCSYYFPISMPLPLFFPHGMPASILSLCINSYLAFKISIIFLTLQLN